MILVTEPYVSQRARWPMSGKHILAQFDEQSIVVYQAYRPATGRFDEHEDIEYNIDMVQQRLEMLVHDMHVDEWFLITALIGEIEQIFVNQIEDGRKGEQSKRVLKVQEVKRKQWEQASEQERQSAAFQASMKQLDRFELSIFPTPERIAEMQNSLEVWREVTTPSFLARDIIDGHLYLG